MRYEAAASWCPACRELTVIPVGRPCAWCDRLTVKRPARRGRPVGKYRKLSRAQVAILHALYVERGLSCNQIAGLVWQRFGFASPKSSSQSIYDAFRAEGLPLRSQAEVTIARNWKHGRKQRKLGGTGPEVAAYRRWLKEQLGRYQPTCKGLKLQPPGRGKPRAKPAMRGSDYCYVHDPGRHDEIEQNLVRMRARLRRPHAA